MESVAVAGLLLALFRPLPTLGEAVAVAVVPATQVQAARARAVFDGTAAAAVGSGAVGDLGRPRILGVATLGDGTAVVGVSASTDDPSGDVKVYGLVALHSGGVAAGSSEALLACDATGAGVAFAFADLEDDDAVLALVGDGGHVDLGRGRVVGREGGAMQAWRDPALQAAARPSVVHIGGASLSTFC